MKLDLEKKTILVVEDSDLIRKEVRQIFESFGLNVIEASNGVDALKVIEEEKSKLNSDLAAISSDINMPKLDGIKLLEIVRSDSTFSNIRFILLTANKEELLKVAAQCMRADGFFIKPLTKELVEQELKRLFVDKSTDRLDALLKKSI